MPQDVFLPDGASSTAASNPVVRVMLNEGTLLAARDETEAAARDDDSIQIQNASTRYPLIVTATVSRAAVFAGHRELRAIGLTGCGLLALLIITLALLIPRRNRANPIVEMERALEDGQFIPYYQPVVDLRSGAIVGAEVLMRWRKPDGTIVAPAAFIPLAESCGLILDMTRAIMRHVRDEMAPRRRRRGRACRIGFNLDRASISRRQDRRGGARDLRGSPIAADASRA